MKRISCFFVITLITIGMISSCAKTTKSKLSQEWKVTSYKMTSSETSPVSSTTQTETRNGATYSLSHTGTSPEYTSKGVINKNTFEINKDGTWKSVLDETTSTTDTNGLGNSQTTLHLVTKSNGYWQFVKEDKTTDFKKNERILFITSQTTQSTDKQKITTNFSTQDTTYTSSTKTSNFAYGSSNKTWVVETSEKDMLKLKFESNEIIYSPQHISKMVIEKTLEK